MSRNAMAGAVTLCGVGLCMIGGAMLVQHGSQAQAASASLPAAAAAVVSATTAQAGPTVVWMGVTTLSGGGTHWIYHRLWSDGRLETRSVPVSTVFMNCNEFFPATACVFPWREVPPAPGGNGFACRSDINGDRVVDGADLSFVLSSFGEQGGCEPEATYPCLDLGNLAGGAAVK